MPSASLRVLVALLALVGCTKDGPSDTEQVDTENEPDTDEADTDTDTDTDGCDELTWFADVDEDGYGDVEAPTTACEQPGGSVSDSGDCDDAAAAVNPGATETCNTIDDDCDTVVDEGSGDIDGDGIYDCLDDACLAGSASAGTTVVDDTCIAPDLTVTDPWNTTMEWQWTGLSTNPEVRDSAVAPKVGNLTDTNGDGVVDTEDTPNVLVSTMNGDTLVLLAGDTGAEVWSKPGMFSWGENAILDADGDGDNDILTFDSSRRVLLVDAAGVTLWTATVVTTGSFPMLTAADLDGDGTVEVITNTHVLDGLTGAVEVTLTAPTGVTYFVPTVGDLDLDGQKEILLGNAIYSSTGVLKWTSPVTGTYGHWAAIVQADADDEGEVLMIGGSRIALHEHDGTVIFNNAAAAAQPGPICVADFDGDGQAEAGWGSTTSFQVYELDGTLLWSAPIQDATGIAGCSAYDFDGDGKYEALIADELRLQVFDGALGTVRFVQEDHASVTLFEYPVVADVDADGSAEILYVSSSYSTGGATLSVLGHAASGWPRSGPTWPIHDFAATNIGDDGSVPTGETPPWLVYNAFRARPSTDTAASDLFVDLVDGCASSCDDTIGTVSVSVQVGNAGLVDIDDDVSIVLFDADSGIPLDSVTLIGGLGAGETSASLEMTAYLADVGAGGVYAAVDDDGTGTGVLDECDESDNAVAWAGPACE